jgi:hypothetical protein
MKITDMAQEADGCRRFNLSIGGFVVKNCRWHGPSGIVLFPLRYDTFGDAHRVIFAHGAQVKRLRDLLVSGELAEPRDRRPCILRVRILGQSHSEDEQWLIFNFTVRGFSILGCRWQPHRGSIQLPVSFHFDERILRYRKKRVVCSFGAHIVRLRRALEKRTGLHQGQTEEVIEAEVAAIP